MAKKRVHELAKQYSMPLPEVIKRLNAYGLDVKAAATAVDEKLADAALTGKPKPKAAANGAAKPKAAAPILAQRDTRHGISLALIGVSPHGASFGLPHRDMRRHHISTWRSGKVKKSGMNSA